MTTYYMNSVLDPECPWRSIPDTEENILRDLERYTLDPIFERYGDFVNRHPQWLREYAEKYAGLTSISGNFLTHSHAFRVYTDDEALISRIEAAVLRNKATPAYQQARAQLLADQ